MHADIDDLNITDRQGKLVMTLLVRNEEDIVRYNIDFHLSKGVDFIIATDNGSTDSTRDILREYEKKGVLHLIDEKNQNHNQTEWNNRMAKVAYEQYGADVIFHCDADEFWYPRSENLKDEIFKRKEDILFVDVVNVLLEDKGGKEVFPKDTRYAVVNPIMAKDYQEESQRTNLFYLKYPPKVMFKTRNKVLFVSQGNHKVINKDDSIIEGKSHNIVIYHYPIRNTAQFLQKTILGGSAYENSDIHPKEVGFHKRRWYASHKKGLLDEEYKKLILQEGEVDKLAHEGFVEEIDFYNVILGRKNNGARWKYFNPKFEYENMFQDFYWAWAGHKYFAYDLIRNVKPKLIVELGTHKGTSFFSFCQAVKDAHYDGELCAVDTWKGDEHSGFYDDNVFEGVKKIKEEYYSGLKVNLLRKRFNDAAGDFENNSIDLLHIDGLHTYTAVKRDFDKWFRKVKKDGIILLHDIFINRGDFGVYKLWRKLKRKYRTIEFHQSYGLGVLFKSSARYQTFINNGREWQIRYSYIAEDKKNDEIIKSFANFEKSLAEQGWQIAGLNQAVAARDSQIAGLNQAVTERDGQIAGLNQALTTRDGQISGLNQAMTARDSQIAGLHQAVAERDAQIAGMNQALVERDAQIAGLNRELAERKAHIDGLDRKLAERDAQVLGLNQAVTAREKQISNLKQTVDERDVKISGMNQELADRDAQFNNTTAQLKWLTEEAANVRAQLSKILVSRTWRIANKLRSMAPRWVKKILIFLVGFGWKIAKKINSKLIKITGKINSELNRGAGKVKKLSLFINRSLKFEKSKPSMFTEDFDFLGYLDCPRSNENCSMCRGWFVSKKPIKKFELFAGDIKITDLERNIIRKDVDAAVPGYDHVIKKGFECQIPLMISENLEKKKRVLYVRFYFDDEHYVDKFHTEVVLGDKFIEDKKAFAVPCSKEPLVSIIVPVWNKWEFTYRCLSSIVNNSGDIPYEVIMANDASPIKIPEIFTKTQGLKIINNSSNLGFLRNCNNAVKCARGKYILFLNNDTEVQPGWLSALVGTAEKDDKVGMVGGKLLFPDGRLQESGSAMDKDGWGNPYGRFDDPNKYEYNYVKEVDFLVGACLLIRKDIFDKLGGFDKQYSPAFYEEFDLEFAIRELGYKIVYQPKALIVHHLSSTYGTETRDSLSIINHAKFMKKWDVRMITKQMRESDLFLARDRSREKNILLVIDWRVPDYDTNSGSLTTYHYLELFLEMGFKIIFIPHNMLRAEPYTTELQQKGIEVVYGKFDFTSWIKQNGPHIHSVWATRPEVAIKYINAIKQYSKARICYFTCDLHYIREIRRFHLEKKQEQLKTSNRLKKIEFYLFEKADWILTPSDFEKKEIEKDFPDKKTIITPVYNFDFSTFVPEASKSFEERNGLFFLGGFDHLPNVDAVIWFVNEIFPVIKNEIPGIKLYVGGSCPPPEIKALDGPDIMVLGYIKDLSSIFQKIRVFVAPLRYGAGVKGKILMSMYHGVPVVTTNVGNEGINLKAGDEAFIADNPLEFARLTVELYSNPEIWEKFSKNSIPFLKKNYSREKTKQIMLEVFRMREKHQKISTNELVNKSFELVNKGKSYLPLCADHQKGPEEVHFELTYDCNLKCVMCNLWDRYRSNPSLRGKELSADEIKRIMESSEYLNNVKMVLLTGGEPFLKKDFEEICSYLINTNKDLSVGLQSNFFHTKLILDKLTKIHNLCKPVNLWIGSSMDGLDEKHDEVRGVKGAFSAMIKTINEIKFSFPHINLCLSLTITGRNYNELLKTYKLSKELGLDFAAQFAVPWENTETYAWDPKVLDQIEKNMDIILDDIIDNHKEPVNIGLLSKIYFLKGVTLYQKEPHRFFKRCVAGAKFAIFSPNGDLYFCPILKNKLAGNIRDHNYKFDSLWFSDEGNNIRKFINDGNCHCWLNCIVHPNAREAIEYAQALPKK